MLTKRPVHKAYVCLIIARCGKKGPLRTPKIIGADIYSEPPWSLSRMGDGIEYACVLEVEGESFQKALDSAKKCLNAKFMGWVGKLLNKRSLDFYDESGNRIRRI